jgi:3-isopropylmalate dehydratase small subunit
MQSLAVVYADDIDTSLIVTRRFLRTIATAGIAGR